MHKIVKVNDNEYFEYQGDVQITGNVGKNATIIVNNGNLTIDGNVGAKTEIKLSQNANSGSSSHFFGNNVVINNITTGKTLYVNGNVEEKVKISSSAADLKINGSVGVNCHFNTANGDIYAGDVGNHVNFKTMNGDIKLANIGSEVVIESMNGDVKAGLVGKNSSLKTMNGDVKVQSKDSSATLETMYGCIYEGEIKRKVGNDQSNFISIGNMSFMGNGRVTVNGLDLTDLINKASCQNNIQTEEPVRYTKRY